MSSTILTVFPKEGVQTEITANLGTVALGDVTTVDTILLENKEITGDTSISKYTIFHDDTTDERRCVSQNTKTVDENHTTCTSTTKLGRLGDTEEVMVNAPEQTDIRGTDVSTGTETTTSFDSTGISFDSNTAGVTLGTSPNQFRLYYNDVVDKLQIQFYDTIGGEWVVKKEYSR